MLTLRSGSSSLVVAPEFGAGLTGWLDGRTALLRRALPQATIGGNPHTMGCIPLLPYCNRIDHARFTWAGTDYQLARNFGDQPHSIHGIGWQRAWQVTRTTAQSVTLNLTHRPDAAWPFAFHAVIVYQLTGPDLTVTLAMTNRHDAPAPAGIGLHPYFPKAGQPDLQFDASGAWENGPDALPRAHGPVPPDWQHTQPRAIAEDRLDNCFTGWAGAAGIQSGAASLRISASAAFRHLQVFTPTWADFFCVEPVSHVPDALNRPDLPQDQAMHILQPNETLAGTIRLMPGVHASNDPPIQVLAHANA